VNEDQQKTFIAGLRNGLGLTKTSRMMLLHPKDVSAFIQSNPSFNYDCEQALLFSSKVLLVNSDTLLREKKFDKWQTQKSHIKKFVTELIFWESVCKKENITEANVLRALTITSDEEDAATSVGLSSSELKMYIMESIYLQQSIQDMRKI